MLSKKYFIILLFSFVLNDINLFPDISEESLPKLIKMTEMTEIRVAIMFYYPSCPHCEFAQPIIKSIAQDFFSQQKKIGFFKTNCMKYPNLIKQYKITSFPSIQIFKNGIYEKSVPPGFSEAPPILKSWFEQIDSKSGVIQFAQLTKQQINKREIEFKRSLGDEFLPKVNNLNAFAEIAFKEIYDSNEHNYYPDDRDLLEAFFGQLIIYKKKYVFPQKRMQMKQKPIKFEKKKSISKIENYMEEEQKKQKVFKKLKDIRKMPDEIQKDLLKLKEFEITINTYGLSQIFKNEKLIRISQIFFLKKLTQTNFLKNYKINIRHHEIKRIKLNST